MASEEKSLPELERTLEDLLRQKSKFMVVEGEYETGEANHIQNRLAAEINTRVKKHRTKIGILKKEEEEKNALHPRVMVRAPKTTFDKLPSVVELKGYYDQTLRFFRHLKDLLPDKERNEKLRFSFKNLKMILDFTHTKIDERAFEMLLAVIKT